jgi:uncharacterized protein (DUF2252 family)
MSKSRKTEDADAVERIAASNSQWHGQLLTRKFDAMAHDASSFLRATAHLFFDRLGTIALPPSPLVFGCGDLHLENFGSYSGENRLTYFDQNDFDEAVLMPAAVEMVRFLASVIVTIRLHEPDDLDPRRQAKQALDAYAAALSGGKPGWIERELARGPLADLMSGLAGRSHRDQLDLFSRVGRHGRRKLLRDGRRTFPLPKDAESIETEIKSTLAAIGKERGERGFWKLRDLSCRIAGKGSLGRPRYVALVKGHGDPDGNFLVDIKSAWPSAALAAVQAPQPVFADAAERVVFVQRLSQARSPAFLQSALLANQPFVLRELQPSEDRLAIEALVERPKRLSHAIETLAHIAAWNQLRGSGRRGAADAEELVAFGADEHWRRELLEAAAESAAEVERDYASFEAAWRKRDPRLTALAAKH